MVRLPGCWPCAEPPRASAGRCAQRAACTLGGRRPGLSRCLHRGTSAAGSSARQETAGRQLNGSKGNTEGRRQWAMQPGNAARLPGRGQHTHAAEPTQLRAHMNLGRAPPALPPLCGGTGWLTAGRSGPDCASQAWSAALCTGPAGMEDLGLETALQARAPRLGPGLAVRDAVTPVVWLVERKRAHKLIVTSHTGGPTEGRGHPSHWSRQKSWESAE